MMTRSSSPTTPLLHAASRAAVVVVTAVSVGCGNLSQEDLLFLAGVPPKEAVELRPAGANPQTDDVNGNTQAMEEECADGDLRCLSNNAAAGLNTLTFFLLDVIDFITRQPPTERRKGRRVWGPFRDEEGDRKTHRFEMVRSEDGTTFAFCLHAADGEIDKDKAGDVTCATDVDDSGLALILSGQFTPGETRGARARSGVGEMVLEISRVRDLAQLGKTMTIVFDNDEGTHIDVTVEGGVVPGSTVTTTLTHVFNRNEDGSGDYSLATFAPIDEFAGPELFKIKAAWLADQSGRAEASVARISNLENPVITAYQCWDAELAPVYTHVEGPPGADLPPDSGDEAQCSIQEDLL